MTWRLRIVTRSGQPNWKHVEWSWIEISRWIIHRCVCVCVWHVPFSSGAVAMNWFSQPLSWQLTASPFWSMIVLIWWTDAASRTEKNTPNTLLPLRRRSTPALFTAVELIIIRATVLNNFELKTSISTNFDLESRNYKHFFANFDLKNQNYNSFLQILRDVTLKIKSVTNFWQILTFNTKMLTHFDQFDLTDQNCNQFFY